MRFQRKLYATAMSLPTIISFRRVYLCDECHKIHKFCGKEFSAFGGWWEKYVFVSQECADKCIQESCNILLRDALKDIMKGHEELIELPEER